jgi:hypothetical protein
MPDPSSGTLDAELGFADKLCRGSPQDDVLDVISLRNQGMLMIRVLAITDLLDAYTKRGREQGAAAKDK